MLKVEGGKEKTDTLHSTLWWLVLCVNSTEQWGDHISSEILFLGMSLMEILVEINIGINRLNKADFFPQSVKNLPAMQETLVWFPGWEDPLEKG